MEVKVKETEFWNDVDIFWLWLCVWKLKFLLHGYLKVCSSNVSLQFYPSAGIKLFLKVFLFLYLFAVYAHKVFAVDDSFYLFCKGFFNI